MDSRPLGLSDSVADVLGLLRSFALYRRPGRQRALRRFYGGWVQPGDLVFDIGAHLGDRSVAFADLGARVVALEPHPRVARWLETLVRRRGEVIVRREALGRSVGTATLAISRRNPTVSTLAEGWRARMPEVNRGFRGVRWEANVRVSVTTLDALIERYGVPAFCKIDVEGYEAEALEGLGQPIPALSLEFVQGALDVAASCVRRLERLGTYEFNAAPGEERRFLFDEWLPGERVLRWLDAGAAGVPSGDLYARTAR